MHDGDSPYRREGDATRDAQRKSFDARATPIPTIEYTVDAGILGAQATHLHGRKQALIRRLRGGVQTIEYEEGAYHTGT